MNGSIADVFRKFATDRNGLASDAEWDRFLEAARVLLLLDPGYKLKSGRQRNRISNLLADTAEQREEIATKLRDAVCRAVADARSANSSGAWESEPLAARVLLGRRILAAHVVARALPRRPEQVALLSATILLHKIREDALASDMAKRAEESRAQNKGRGAQEAGWKALRREAARLLSEPNAPARKTDRARILLRRLPGHFGARKPKDLIEVARRRRIEI